MQSSYDISFLVCQNHIFYCSLRSIPLYDGTFNNQFLHFYTVKVTWLGLFHLSKNIRNQFFPLKVFAVFLKVILLYSVASWLCYYQYL